MLGQSQNTLPVRKNIIRSNSLQEEFVAFLKDNVAYDERYIWD
jgi:hypothetical protein